MATKADFNAEEWSTVVEGPVLAGMRVVTAHRGGTIRESLAMGKVYASARERQGQSELADALVSSPPAVDQERVRAVGDVARATTEGLREALGILERKASPEELETYKRFVLDVAEAAAKAHKEGGFIGIGGKPVSESEQAALDEIAAALRPSAAATCSCRCGRAARRTRRSATRSVTGTPTSGCAPPRCCAGRSAGRARPGSGC